MEAFIAAATKEESRRLTATLSAAQRQGRAIIPFRVRGRAIEDKVIGELVETMDGVTFRVIGERAYAAHFI